MTSVERSADSSSQGYGTVTEPLTKDAPVPAILVAEHILYLRQQAGVETNFVHLLGLTYMAHALMLTSYGEPLFLDRIEAWAPGPSIPVVYGAFQHHKLGPIGRSGTPGDKVLGPDARMVISVVENSFRDTDWRSLTSSITVPGTPWYNTFFGLGEGSVITDESIRSYYSNLVENAETEPSSVVPT